MQTERAIIDLTYPPELSAAYQKWNILLAHWDVEAEPEKLAEIQAVEAEIHQVQALYEVDIAAYLHEDNWVTIES